ncbi:MAG: outer membrane beta-barrel protein [Pseudomonadota bacterium]
MKSPRFKITSLVLAAAALTLSAGAQAQSSTSNTGSGYTMYGPGANYFGFNAGRSDFKLGGGVGGFPSDTKDNAYSIYGGSHFNENFALELGYNDFGTVARGGGNTKASGFNLSLVGKLPLSPAFAATARVGTTYGRTNVSSNPASGIGSGKESGFGLSYGLGLEYAFTPSWSGVLQYDEHKLKFVGSGRESVNTTSVGVKYRF